MTFITPRYVGISHDIQTITIMTVDSCFINGSFLPPLIIGEVIVKNTNSQNNTNFMSQIPFLPQDSVDRPQRTPPAEKSARNPVKTIINITADDSDDVSEGSYTNRFPLLCYSLTISREAWRPSILRK